MSAAAGRLPASTNPPGTICRTPPGRCNYQAVSAQPYYSCTDGPWFASAYDANGVYYRVVTAP